MDAPAQATLTAAANMQALEDWIAQCQRLDEIVAAGLMNRREASAWKVANKPRNIEGKESRWQRRAWPWILRLGVSQGRAGVLVQVDGCEA